MTPLVYLGCLAVSLAGMAVLDWRLVLFFRAAPVRAGIVLAAGLAFFLAWDLSGIALGIFHRGRTEYMTGIMLAPELPLEEVFFLAFLCYLAMNLFQLFSRRLRTGSFAPPAARARAAKAGIR